MSPRTRRRLGRAAIACVCVALGGCASESDRAQNLSLAALKTVEPKAGMLPDDPKCTEKPFRSLTPSTLPRPGVMPRGTSMAEIRRLGHLRVGVDQNSLQLGYLNPTTTSQQMRGFDIDVVREVAAAIFGVPASRTRAIDRFIRYTALSTQQRQTAIEGEEVDIVASAYSIKCERFRHMRFSSVYHRADARLLVLKKSAFSDLSDPAARGKRICATKSSTTEKYLKAVRKSTGIVPVSVSLRSDCLVKLQEGDVDAIASDDAILFGFQIQDPQTEIVGPSFQCEQWAIAINKDHRDLVHFVNGVVERLRRRGRLQQISRQWLRELPRSPRGPKSCYARFGGGPR